MDDHNGGQLPSNTDSHKEGGWTFGHFEIPTSFGVPNHSANQGLPSNGPGTWACHQYFPTGNAWGTCDQTGQYQSQQWIDAIGQPQQNLTNFRVVPSDSSLVSLGVASTGRDTLGRLNAFPGSHNLPDPASSLHPIDQTTQPEYGIAGSTYFGIVPGTSSAEHDIMVYDASQIYHQEPQLQTIQEGQPLKIEESYGASRRSRHGTEDSPRTPYNPHAPLCPLTSEIAAKRQTESSANFENAYLAMCRSRESTVSDGALALLRQCVARALTENPLQELYDRDYEYHRGRHRYDSHDIQLFHRFTSDQQDPSDFTVTFGTRLLNAAPRRTSGSAGRPVPILHVIESTVYDVKFRRDETDGDFEYQVIRGAPWEARWRMSAVPY